MPTFIRPARVDVIEDGAGFRGDWRRAVSAAQRPAIEAPALQIHFHGLSADDVAALLRASDERPLADHGRDQATLA